MSALLLAVVLSSTSAEAQPEFEDQNTSESAPSGFIKGELAHAGVIRLVPKRSFLGVRLGGLIQDEVLYGVVAPTADLRLMQDRLHIGLHVPLNFEIYALRNAADAGTAGGGFDQAGRLREGDWDEPRDFVKVLRYVRYGKKEDPVYLSVGQLHAATLGHGQIMRRYASNVDVNQSVVGAEVDAYGRYGGFELSVADVTRGNLFGVLGFVKPLAFFSEHWMPASLSAGFTWATDQRAPIRLLRRPPVGMAAVGSVINVDDNARNPPAAETGAVNLFGLDAELKLVKTENTDLKTYVDYSFFSGAGGGLTVGALGRFNFRSSQDTVHLLRTRFELRTYDANYTPSYFDVLYEYQKYQYAQDLQSTGPDYPTKRRSVLEREGGRHYGAYVELSYSLPGWITLAASVALDSKGQDHHLMLHAEVPLRYLDVFATYHQRNFTKPFTLKENDLIYAGARVQLLPILFLNGRVQKSFAWETSAFDDLGAYGENFSFQADIELGFEI